MESRGQLVIPKKLREKYNMVSRTIIEIEDTGKSLLLKPFNTVAELKETGKGLYGEPVKYRRKLREEWEYP